MTAYNPVYRFVVYQPRSQDPNEAIALQPVAGAPHADYFKVTTGPAAAGPTKPTAAMLSHSGMTVFTAANCVDGNLANTGWGTDSAVSGAWLKIDLGAGAARRYQICRIYVLAGTYAGVYDVEYSDDNAAWTKAVTGFKPTTGDTWHSATWQDAGTHRYWRILLTNTPGAGPELAELEFWELDGPGDWKPYLQPPEGGRSGRIDRLNKRTDVGVQSFQVIDAALTPGDNLTRWATAGFGDAKGKLRIGNLKIRAWESTDGGVTFTPFWYGRVRQAGLAQPNVFDLRIRELADDTEGLAFVGRPHASITYAGFPTLLPVGIGVDYGSVKAARPLTGAIAAFNVQGGSIPTARLLNLDVDSGRRPDNLVTRNFLEQVPMGQYAPIGGGVGGVVWGRLPQFPASAAGARAKVKRLDTQAVGYFKIGAFTQTAIGNGHWRITSLAIGELKTDELGYMAFPPNGTSVELTVEGEHRASKTTPLVIGDVHLVTLWKHLLDGKFGFLWTPPEVLPAGRAYGDARLPVAYNTTKMATLEADARFPTARGIITKRELRSKFIEANLLRLGNLTYYRDGAGVVQPVDLRLPSDVSAVPIISDADLVIPEGGAWPSWDYDRAQAITRIDAAYYIDIPTAVEDLNRSADVYPEIQNAGFSEIRHPVSILDVGSADLGDEPFQLDCKLLRTLQDETLGEQQRETYLERRLIDIATEIARPFQVGAPTSVLAVRRGGTGDAQPGEVRRTTVSTLVDPATNKRGGTRLVQVLERTPRGPYLELRVVDLGLATAGAVPTIATPTQEAGNTLQAAVVNVTLNAAAHPVEVHYAVTATSVGVRPADSDARWTAIPDRLVRASGNVTFRGLPAGTRIWVRARTFPDARVDWQLPSAWVYPAGTGYVDLGVLTAPSVPVSSNISGKAFRVSVTLGATDVPTEWLLATPVGDPRVVVARTPPGTTFFDFPGDTGVILNPSTTYRIGIRHYIAASAVSAEVTIDVTTTATPATAPNTAGMSLLVGVP